MKPLATPTATSHRKEYPWFGAARVGRLVAALTAGAGPGMPARISSGEAPARAAAGGSWLGPAEFVRCGSGAVMTAAAGNGSSAIALDCGRDGLGT